MAHGLHGGLGVSIVFSQQETCGFKPSWVYIGFLQIACLYHVHTTVLCDELANCAVCTLLPAPACEPKQDKTVQIMHGTYFR